MSRVKLLKQTFFLMKFDENGLYNEYIILPSFMNKLKYGWSFFFFKERTIIFRANLMHIHTYIYIPVLLFIDFCFLQKCGRVDEQIELLRKKLRLIYSGEVFNGKRTKTARSHGKKFQVSVKQETSRILVSIFLFSFS